jgi:hypothetical protein
LREAPASLSKELESIFADERLIVLHSNVAGFGIDNSILDASVKVPIILPAVLTKVALLATLSQGTSALVMTSLGSTLCFVLESQLF